jgi:hypothetical protein
LKVAYHFDADAYGFSYGDPVDQLLFSALREIPANRLHIRVKSGDLLVHFHISDAEQRARYIAERIVQPDHPVWTTLDPDFAERAARADTYILYLDGITSRDAKHLDRQLRADRGYLGCLELNLANPAHWVLYEEKLSSTYRIVGRQLRLLHIAAELEPDLPVAEQEEWLESGTFESVVFEDTGLQETLFDPYRTLDAAQRAAELEDLLSSQFSMVVTETLIRTGELDPRLRDALHAALTSFERFESTEQLAHVATSCRRFLERLADILFLARSEARGERELTQDKYVNRLWAYVEDNLEGAERNLVVSTLIDIGNRIDKIHVLANKGVHAPQVAPAEMQRLLIGLVSTTYDVLTLAPPGLKARMEPYAETLVELAKDIFEDPKG